MDAFHNTSGATAITDFIISIADSAYKYGTGTSGAWTNILSDRLIQTTSTFFGDPSRFSQGLHSTTLQDTYYTDNYISYIKSILEDTSNPLSIIPNYTSEETIDYYSSITDMAAVPYSTENKKYGPIIITLDWDASLVDPSEAKPIYKYYNVVEGSRGAYSMIINHACTTIINSFDLEAIWCFCSYASQGSGEANIARWIATNGGVYSSSLMDYIREHEERIGVISHVVMRLHKQIFSNNDIKTLTIAMVRGIYASEGDKYLQMMNSLSRFNRLKSLCAVSPTSFTYSLISSKTTNYNIQGPMTIVTSIDTALNEAGGTSQLKASSHSVPSESIIRWATPLKRNVIWPVGDSLTQIYTTDEVINGRIQIPCTNWDDVRRVQEAIPETITQYSKTYTFIADDLYEAVDAFYASIHDLGIRTASISYDTIKGRGSFDVSYTYCT